jgi:hypothetical protein
MIADIIAIHGLSRSQSESHCHDQNRFPLVAFHGRFAISSVEGKGSKKQ